MSKFLAQFCLLQLPVNFVQESCDNKGKNLFLNKSAQFQLIVAFQTCVHVLFVYHCIMVHVWGQFGETDC